MKNFSWIRLIVIFVLAMGSGIFIGAKMFNSSTQTNDISKAASKFREILHYINNEYVDTVNTDQLAEEAIGKMLEKLDPHSVYIPPQDVQMAKSQLEGNFEGVGIEFQIIKDTLIVVTPISGGPSEAVGVQAGDKIVEVDGKNITNIKLTNNDVFKYLRGKKGTKVSITVKRRNQNKLLFFTITRDKIPTFSMDVAFMIDAEVGYIKINRFSESTYREFKQGLTDLKSKGMKKLILDLRGNPGGYMDRATQMADEFLDGDKLIVFTKSTQSRYNTEMRTIVPGDFEKGAVVVLIDEGSASASEIVSGALQDNDRAIIVGRRSFGKGLVQMPINLSDRSELRLTISRYYTPSGRSIQKPYSKDGSDDYNMDLLKRYKHGEFFTPDSIKFDKSLMYKTAKGRIVYGGGGIMPDYFVARDTSMYSGYLNSLLNSGLVRDFTFEYGLNNKKTLEKMGYEAFRKDFEITDAMIKELIAQAEKQDIKYVEADFKRSKKYLSTYMKSLIARTVWGNEGFYPIFLEDDEILAQAKKIIAEMKE